MGVRGLCALRFGRSKIQPPWLRSSDIQGGSKGRCASSLSRHLVRPGMPRKHSCAALLCSYLRSLTGILATILQWEDINATSYNTINGPPCVRWARCVFTAMEPRVLFPAHVRQRRPTICGDAAPMRLMAQENPPESRDARTSRNILTVMARGVEETPTAAQLHERVPKPGPR